MTAQTIQYKTGYYIHIIDDKSLHQITVQHSPSGYGGDILGTFKSLQSAKVFISKHIAEKELESFIRGYIVCALWSSNDWSDESLDNPPPLDENYSIDDIAPVCMGVLEGDCADFVKGNKALLNRYYKAYKPGSGYNVQECAGHDFWLTRNGHGAGFWDRGLGVIGEKLSDSARVYGSVDLYVGDDGKIYC